MQLKMFKFTNVIRICNTTITILLGVLPPVDFPLDNIHIFHICNPRGCCIEWQLYYLVCSLLQDRHESLNFLHHIHICDQKNQEHIRKSHICRFHGSSTVGHFQCIPNFKTKKGVKILFQILTCHKTDCTIKLIPGIGYLPDFRVFHNHIGTSFLD